MGEEVTFGLNAPVGLLDLAEDQFAEFNALLGLQTDQEVASFTVDLGFVLEEQREVLTNIATRVNTQNATIKQALVALLRLQQFKILVRHHVEVHIRHLQPLQVLSIASLEHRLAHNTLIKRR